MKILVISASITDTLRLALNSTLNQLFEVTPETITAASELPEYDVIVLVQTANLSTAGATRLLSLIKERQQPVVVANYYSNASGVGVTAKHGLGILNLANTITETNSVSLGYTTALHSAMNKSVFNVNTTTSFYNTATYATTCSDFKGVGYTIYSKLTNAAGQGLFVHFPRNVATNGDGVTYPFDVYFIGCLSINAALSESYAELVQNLLNQMAVNYFIQGVIKDVSLTPVSRSVGVYDMSTKALINIVKSDQTTGAFTSTFNSSSRNPKVFAVAFPSENSEEVPQVVYNLTPNILQD